MASYIIYKLIIVIILGLAVNSRKLTFLEIYLLTFKSNFNSKYQASETKLKHIISVKLQFVTHYPALSYIAINMY